jgi:hypothetical protein
MAVAVSETVMSVADENLGLTGGASRARAGRIQPTACAAKIAEARSRWRRLRRFLAVSLLAAWTATAMTVAVLLDSWWRGGHLARAALLLALAASIAWVIRRTVLPLWGRLSFDQAAVLLERTHPSLSGRLVTAVQLAEPSRRAGSGASTDLYEFVCAAAESEADRIDLAKVVPANPSIRRSAAAWALVAALLIVSGFNRASTSIGIGRLLLPWQEINWPKRTRIEVTGANQGKPIRVVRGGTLSLAGRAAGIIPSTGVLRVQSQSGVVDRAYFEMGTGGGFSVQYRPVMQDLRVSLEIGDAATPTMTIEMVPPPEITSIRAECTYPEYTQQEMHAFDDGNVQAVFGTQVKLQITTNKAIAEAKLAWDGGQSIAMTSSSESAAETAFPVQASGSYRIHLTDALGFHNADPVIYRIEMIDNQYPQFEKTVPAIDRRVTPSAVLAIEAEVTDDYGVTEVNLCYRRGNDAKPTRIDKNLLDQPGKHPLVRYQWPLESLDAKPGDTVTYWLEAHDAGEHATKHDWPISRHRKLTVMSEADLSRALGDERAQIMEKLTQLESLQAECMGAVKQIAGTANSDRAPVVQEKTRAEKWRQDRIARTTGQLADSLGHLADDYVTSRIGQEEDWQRLGQTAKRLAELGGTEMPTIVLALDEALNSLRTEAASPTQPSEERK